MVKKTGLDIKCFECEKLVYVPKWRLELKEGKKFYCSKNCSNKAHSKFLTKHIYKNLKCNYCSKEFQQVFHRKKYCSTLCSSRANLKTINSTEPKKSGTKPEVLFKQLLEVNKVNFIFQKNVPWKKGWKKWYDFYLPEFNLLIEIDGTYWHGKEIKTKDLNKQQWKTRLNDKFKNILAKSRGYKLLRIWSDEINNLNLKEILKCYE